MLKSVAADSWIPVNHAKTKSVQSWRNPIYQRSDFGLLYMNMTCWSASCHKDPLGQFPVVSGWKRFPGRPVAPLRSTDLLKFEQNRIRKVHHFRVGKVEFVTMENSQEKRQHRHRNLKLSVNEFRIRSAPATFQVDTQAGKRCAGFEFKIVP